MKRIYSKVIARLERRPLLHMVISPGDVWSGDERLDASPEEEFLQLALIKPRANKAYRAHVHKKILRGTDITQEAWVVLSGKVEVDYHDIDGAFLETVTLGAGDCSITFRGGHAYRIREPNTVVYEFKTGPYLGQTEDKTFIDG